MNARRTPRGWWLGLTLGTCACGDSSAPPASFDDNWRDPATAGDPDGTGNPDLTGSLGGAGSPDGSDDGSALTSMGRALEEMQATCDALSPDSVYVVGNFQLRSMGNPQAIWDMERPGYPCLVTSGITLISEPGRLITTGPAQGVYEHVFDRPIRSGGSYMSVESVPDVELIAPEACSAISKVWGYPDRSDVFMDCTTATGARYRDQNGLVVRTPIGAELSAVGRNGLMLASNVGLGVVYLGNAPAEAPTFRFPGNQTFLTARSSGDGFLVVGHDAGLDVTDLYFIGPGGTSEHRGTYPAPDSPLVDSYARDTLDAAGALYSVDMREGKQAVIKRVVGAEAEQVVFRQATYNKDYGLQIHAIDLVRLTTGA